ncbi:hypothetical protein MUK42_15318 [Musa troglodytarum]|uniref:Uncharacterized protein n=1 Tax=Musa troglodytarum TaxID=320322 RepID=A0A9E7LAN6_9LILI|nr:hypothetical protein MUK42_15318 [Musa troglodytarum]
MSKAGWVAFPFACFGFRSQSSVLIRNHKGGKNGTIRNWLQGCLSLVRVHVDRNERGDDDDRDGDTPSLPRCFSIAGEVLIVRLFFSPSAALEGKKARSSLSYCTVTQTSWKQEMKRSRAEGAMLPAKATAEASGKAQRRQKASTPKLATAVASPENAAARGGGDDKNPAAAAAAAAAAADIQQSSFIPSAPAEEKAVGWGDGAVELGEWWWCLWGVEEEKLLGWFPFVDEDFVCSDSRGSEAPGGLLWEEEDHDIWELQHIHEIPHAAAK